MSDDRCTIIIQLHPDDNGLRTIVSHDDKVLEDELPNLLHFIASQISDPQDEHPDVLIHKIHER